MDVEHLTVFLLAFALGGIMVYFTAAATTTVIVYPTPDNAGQVEYKDKAGNCYRYSSKKIKCPAKGARKIPLQE